MSVHLCRYTAEPVDGPCFVVVQSHKIDDQEYQRDCSKPSSGLRVIESQGVVQHSRILCYRLVICLSCMSSRSLINILIRQTVLPANLPGSPILPDPSIASLCLAAMRVPIRSNHLSPQYLFVGNDIHSSGTHRCRYQEISLAVVGLTVCAS